MLPESVRQPLELRRWALRVLRGDLAIAPQVPATAWRRFLAIERCAFPLARHLGQSYDSYLAPSGISTFRAALEKEARKILAARSQLAEIALVAREQAWQIVALKGAVCALDDKTAVDLDDIDLLAEPKTAHLLADALGQLGYRRQGSGSPLHIESCLREGSLPVEIHVSADVTGVLDERRVWSALQPLSMDGLFRLAPADHLWQVIVHLGIQHPYRRGVIRDLLVLKRAMEECDPQALGAVRSRTATHAHGASLSVVWAAASALGADGSVALELERDAAIRHLMNSWITPLHLPRVVEADVGNWSFALLMGPAERSYRWNAVWQRARGPSLARPIAWLERTVPRAGRVARVALRLIRSLVALPPALMLAWAASRATRDLDLSLKQRGE
ncbi:hypothetical protein HRbin33_02028 [bacterium HR33]|nr:hypothetical protein HRbin33_02028 [bacterium HR33]